ncbi:sigma 54-interacting transcriptional regulator [Chitinimonas koreensis]|uniref:sigma 54-interacting transcriptional regulator n=1 Tax=Chitinimonas koreensis TaxID=356302 RepID=UPI000419A145|nr:sigma 54-interacting transcriptional regulator [Chitinimonas koreensis]QNM95352.1 sigma 54-interacting transcriptional regulator [Chitinimonas koreensis]
MDGLSRLNLAGSSPVFQQVLHSLHRLAEVDATVLIGGETGTGKELAARALHYLGPRSDRPFIPVNCGALSDTLLESELFGHERGAFTDARRSSSGLVGEAQGGTLFLDEIDTLSPRAQGALLRFLQDKTYRRVGGSGQARADVRVVVASNADLAAMAEARQFRTDLLYRLNVLSVVMPPLRERAGDAVELARLFVARLCSQYRRPLRALHEDAVAFIASYRWPGNVRELENVIHRDFLLSEGELLYCAEARQRLGKEAAGTEARHCFKDAKARAIAEFERRFVGELLARAGGNISQAARLAGKDRSAFGKLVRKYGMAAESLGDLTPG